MGTMKRGLKTITGLHAFDGGTGLSLSRDIAALSDTAAEGICLFRYGAFISAAAADGGLIVYNPLEKPVTALHIHQNGEFFSIAVCIEQGEETQISLPFIPDRLEAFSGDTPLCIFLCR